MKKSTKKTLIALGTIIEAFILVGTIEASNLNIVELALILTIITLGALTYTIIVAIKIFADKDKLYKFFN